MSGQALLKLFLAEKPNLVRLISRIVGCRVTAEDIAQDVFVRLWGRQGAEWERGLLFRTGQNLALDHLRANKVRRSFAEGVTVEQLSHEAAEPERQASARQDLHSLQAALQSLPERTRRAFLLNRLDGRSYADIAAALEVSVSTVEKDIIQALRAVRGWRDGKAGRS